MAITAARLSDERWFWCAFSSMSAHCSSVAEVSCSTMRAARSLSWGFSLSSQARQSMYSATACTFLKRFFSSHGFTAIGVTRGRQSRQAPSERESTPRVDASGITVDLGCEYEGPRRTARRERLGDSRSGLVLQRALGCGSLPLAAHRRPRRARGVDRRPAVGITHMGRQVASPPRDLETTRARPTELMRWRVAGYEPDRPLHIPPWTVRQTLG